MTNRTEHIAAELRRIRAICPEDIAVLMAPLLQDIEASVQHRPGAFATHDLVAMANSLAQIAAQAGDADTAVAIASLQAEIEAVGPGDLAPAPAQPRSLVREFPVPLLLGMLAAGAVSYGVHVTTQARFAPGSLIGWLLSASTTLLAVALTLRLGSFLTRYLAPRQLTVVSASAAVLALVFALVSFLVHGPEFAHSSRAPTVAVDPAGPDATQSTPTTGADAPGVNLWWLGQTVPTPATEVIDADALAAAAAAAVKAPQGAAPGLAKPAPRRHAPVPPTPGPVDRYAELLDKRVRLVDSQGDAFVGQLTGVSRDAVTLRTEVKMFGRPIQAHRQFLHSAIRSLQAQ